MSNDSIKTLKAPKRRAKRASRPKLVNLDDVPRRVTLRIERADKLTDEQRYVLVNWLRAKINDLGSDALGRNLPPTYQTHLVI